MKDQEKDNVQYDSSKHRFKTWKYNFMYTYFRIQSAIRELQGQVSHWEQQCSHAEETIAAMRVEIEQLMQSRIEKEREIEQLVLAVSAINIVFVSTVKNRRM